MDKKAFEDFVSTQYQPRLLHYRKRARYHQMTYTRLQSAIFLLSSLNTFLIALQHFVDWIGLQIAVIFISILLSALAGIFKFFNYQEKWSFYNKMIVDLEAEYNLYLAEGEQYSQAKDKESLFVVHVTELFKKAATSMPYLTQDETLALMTPTNERDRKSK